MDEELTQYNPGAIAISGDSIIAIGAMLQVAPPLEATPDRPDALILGLATTAILATLATAAHSKTLVYCSEGSPEGFD